MAARTIPTDQNLHPLTDSALLIAMGCFPGISHINKFGSVVNAPADTNSDVWDGGGEYTFPAGTADMSHVSQTTDQVAARGVSITVQGLDVDYLEVEQTIQLDGTDTTTPVALPTPLLRVNRMFVVDALVMTSTIRLHNAAENIDYVDIQIDHNQTLNAIYTVPAGKTAYITSGFADYVPTATKNPDAVHFHFYFRDNENNGGWRVVQSFGIPANSGSYERFFGVYATIPAKADIRLQCNPVAKAAHIHGSFDLILVDD